MEKPQMVTAPTIFGRTFFGLRTDILYNAHYLNESEIIYPAGTVIIIHNHQQKKQRFIRLLNKNNPIKAMTLSPNKRWLALNEYPKAEGEKPIITIYDMNTLKRRKILKVPFEKHCPKEFAFIEFTFDSKFLIAVTGAPHWYMYYFSWDKTKLESHAKLQNPDGTGTISRISCNPADATLIVVTGLQTFRIMNVVESEWSQWGWNKAGNLNITACMWLTPDRIMFGTSDGQIMMVENGELRQNCIFQALDVIEMSLKKVEVELEEDSAETSEKEEDTESLANLEEDINSVKHFVNFPRGFVFCCGPGYVHMFEKETLHHWRKRNVYRISRNSYMHMREYPEWSPLDDIQHLTVDPSQETLLITTWRKQLYTAKLFGPDISEKPEIPFVELGPALHYGRIHSLTMCSWKPMFMTAGEDQSIRVWNYLTDEVEMIKLYPEEVFCISLHPTGLYTLIGFSDKLRYMVVLIDDFKVMREFPIRKCTLAKFSSNGHFFAAVNSQVIQVFSSVSFANMYNLKGHNGKITSLSWAANDLILVSCGAEGAVYEWSMSTGQRAGEMILKNTQFNACVTNRNGKVSYAGSVDGVLREINANTVSKTSKVLNCPIGNISISRMDTMLFITGGDGSILAVRLPLAEKAIFETFYMHSVAVTRIALAYDDQTLVSVAEDASICIWKLTNPQGRAIALDKEFAYSKEILISKKDLMEKINSIRLLSTRISELETEHTYQIRQAEANQSEKLKEVHQGYCNTIEELKEKNEHLDNIHAHEIGMIQQDITKMRSGHESTLQTLEAEFNIRLINEYDRYQNLEDKTSRMRNEYEMRLNNLAENKRQALREMTAKFEAILEEKDMVALEYQEELDLEKREHAVMKNEIEDDVDREILEIRTAYETQVKEEKDANVRVKGETGLMKKKLISANKEIEEYKHQISQLKAEHKEFQKVVSALERESTDLKKEISERDVSIEEKEKRIHLLKRKKQELQKYKFVLNFRISELKNQIEPLERAIKQSKLRILDLEVSLASLLKKKEFRELKIEVITTKLQCAKAEFVKECQRSFILKATIKKIKVDLHDMTGNFQDPLKLEAAVKILFNKYTEDIDFLRSRAADQEAIVEFYRQRDHLELVLETTKNALQKALDDSRNTIHKIMDENCKLLSEMNGLRREVKATRTRSFNMESILGLSARYLPPSTARKTLGHITEDREILRNKYKVQLQEKQVLISALTEDNRRLAGKIGGGPMTEKKGNKSKSTPPGDAAPSTVILGEPFEETAPTDDGDAEH